MSMNDEKKFIVTYRIVVEGKLFSIISGEEFESFEDAMVAVRKWIEGDLSSSRGATVEAKP